MTNCLLFAIAIWWRRRIRSFRAWRNGVTLRPTERYYLIRSSRISWGLFHVLVGRMDRSTGQIKVMSYKPDTAEKMGIELLFKGRVVRGDLPHE